MRPSILASTCFLLLCSISASAQGSTGDLEPQLQGTATYNMPQLAVDAKIDGKVIVGIHVDETGTPKRAWLAAGPAWPCGETPIKAIEELSSTLVDTMMKLRFTPGTRGGKPVAKDVGLSITLKNPLVRKPEKAPIDPATGKPLPQTVNGGVMNGRALSLPTPAYPSAAKTNRDSGAVSVQIEIDEQGHVIRAQALNGAATLQFPAREAACAAKFSPTLLQGNPVKVIGVITYNFNL
jgi:TonB family protein